MDNRALVSAVLLLIGMFGTSVQRRGDTDDIVSYSMRQGDKYDTEIDFFDSTYDGNVSQNYLHDGLGKLTDGEKGNTVFEKGHEWVGWKNDTLIDPGPVEIIFKFNTVRNFSYVKLFCNNYFTKGIRVFQKAVIQYSIGGKYFKQGKTFNFIRDKYIEYARYVVIQLDHIIAKYIKLELYFDAKWILISEVKFESSKYFFSSVVIFVLSQLVVI
ncbi:discoidin domain-containing receptor 2-like [Ruditapes philippinarum]|uniref:discoidin domain-containing receptor 2-like n=1 Tax=Ruditapes philippinarum TaxID=129788 RepID=UPI00295B1882|nr:discoidin domain-containing receptor 2-like [Ruditapes philippinarum]